MVAEAARQCQASDACADDADGLLRHPDATQI